MRGDEAPRLVGDPGPAVKGVDPPAVGVGRPVVGDAGNIDVALWLVVDPFAIAVEFIAVRVELVGQPLVIAITRHPLEFGRALFAPPVEGIDGSSLESERAFHVTVAITHTLAAAHGETLAGEIDEDFAFTHRDHGFTRAHVHAESRGPCGGDAAAGSPELEARSAGTHAGAEGTSENAQAQTLVLIGAAATQRVDLAPFGDPEDLAFSEYDLGPARLVGPHPITGQEGHVQNGLVRTRFVGALDGDAPDGFEETPIAVLDFLGEGRGNEHPEGQAQRNRGFLDVDGQS